MKNKLYIIAFCLLSFIACSDETKVQSITLNPSEMTLKIGESKQIEMLISPISSIIYNPTSWHSSNTNVAQVDAKGNITAIYAGECIITGKTKHHEAYCKVTVIAPEYNLNFTNAIVFDEGIDTIVDKRNLILRLYDDGLSIDSTGSMSGNGLFLNINIYVSADSEGLPLGEYNISDTISDFTIIPGKLKQESNAYYATGSYLGQYTDNGLSALFLDCGNITVSDNYTIQCNLIGSQTEIVKAYFSGNILIYDTNTKKETSIIEYSNTSIEEFHLSSEKNLNHFKISFISNNNTVSFVARAPLSVNTLSSGTYYTSNELKAFTLNTEYCSISSATDTTKISNAMLQFNGTDFTATFTDEYGSEYLLRNQKNRKNIHKLKIKNFVY